MKATNAGRLMAGIVINVLGLIAAVAAACWMIVGQGAFGLYPAVTATALFGLWSILIASQMMVAPAKEPAR